MYRNPSTNNGNDLSVVFGNINNLQQQINDLRLLIQKNKDTDLVAQVEEDYEEDLLTKTTNGYTG